MSFADLKAALRGWPEAAVPARPFPDALQERLRAALLGLRSAPESFGPADLASLVRQTLRGESARYGGKHRLSVPRGGSWPDETLWRLHGCRVTPGVQAGFLEVEAGPWTPDWLPGKTPFEAVERGEMRRVPLPVAADPAVTKVFHRRQYLSSLQAEAVRAVMLSPPGAVRVVVLPTSAGKSLVGLAAALAGQAETGGVSIVVVPTIALATDQLTKACEMCPGVAINAWKSGLTKDERTAIIERLRAGQQRVLFAAPESVVGPRLSAELSRLAGVPGAIRAFVVDEAHLVGQWGTSFRPEFQTMSALWRDLRAQSPPETRFRTLLMTATLTRESYIDIRSFFNPPEGLETLGSVYLRPESRDLFFQARCEGDDQKIARVLETLRHAPRPAILYVTKVREAIDWHQRCLDAGWRRVGLMHGRCAPAERDAVLERWNRNELDLMVATSAFGLGMDKEDVRLVLHACVPETLDRFYQEVGRGGRDGRAAASVLLWQASDEKTAERMSTPRVISKKLGFERWNRMWWMGRNPDGDGDVRLVNLRSMRRGVEWDSERNLDWNLKTLLLLARAGVIQILHRPFVEPARLDEETDEAFSQRRSALRAAALAFCPVQLLQPRPITPADWDEQVGVPRQQSAEAAWKNWRRMQAVLREQTPVEKVLRELYRVPEAGIHHVGLDGQDATFTPPQTVCCTLKPALRDAPAVRNGRILLVTYRTTGISERTIYTSLRELLFNLADQGIREVAMPEALLTGARWPASFANPLQEMTAQTPEKFLVVRGFGEEEPCGTPPLALPRVSLLGPEHAGRPVSKDLLNLERPVHLVVLPAECPDHRDARRLVGDADQPTVVRLEDLERTLRRS